ncbi:hypothetical protein HT031_006631 [Scenedesmus sp. PABB004]|nr:hypothetical protein HT031_006631 [Scenedesmus sp. PABB004]
MANRSALSARLANMGFMKRATGGAAAPPPAGGGSGSGGAAARPAAGGERQSRHGRQSQQSQEQQQEQQQQEQQQAQQSQPQQQPEQHAPSAGKPVALSSRLSGMKFMQRAAAAKRGYAEALGEGEAARADAEWVAPGQGGGPGGGGAAGGCRIIQERDPLPRGVCGRRSFGAFNPETERLQEEADAVAEGRPPPSALAAAAAAAAAAAGGEQDGVSVSDDAMAGWGRGKSVLTSLRMQRTQKRQRVG